MPSTPQLIEARHVHGCVVYVRFTDGVAGNVDLSYLLKYDGVFEPLRDPRFFARLRVDEDGDTILWPNEADIAPDTLYDLAVAASHVAA
jgi:hypothetical protein